MVSPGRRPDPRIVAPLGGRARRLVLGALLSVAFVGPGAAQQKQAEPAAARPAQIDRNGVLILIRTTLLALHQANETGNYTVLRDLAAPGFRDANTAARLAEIFATQRAQKLDLSGVAALDPQLTLLPQIEANGLLHMSGFFPSVPNQVNFELLFAPVEGRWRPYGIAVNVGSAAPSAPPDPPSAPPQAAKPEPQQKQAKPEPKPSSTAKPKPTPAAKRPGEVDEAPARQ